MSGKKIDEQAATALVLLDRAIRQVHPERFFGGDDEAAVYLNSPRIALNAFLGRPQTQRLFPIDYNQLLLIFVEYEKKGLLQQAMKLAQSDLVMYAVMRGVWQEFKLVLLKQPHDQINIGKEVESATKTLIGLLNRNASTKPVPMP